MIAFKFLARGAVGPFTGFQWPTPSAAEPGKWVEAPSEGFPGRGIHACLVEHLPYWLEEELWEVELPEVVQRASTQLIAMRGRLLHQVTGWTGSVGWEFGQACAIRTRDAAAELLRKNHRGEDADQLLAGPNLVELARAARAIAGRNEADFLNNIAGYVADAAHFANLRDFACASYIAAELARVSTRSAEALVSERAWQGRWIASRLNLTADDSTAAL